MAGSGGGGRFLFAVRKVSEFCHGLSARTDVELLIHAPNVGVDGGHADVRRAEIHPQKLKAYIVCICSLNQEKGAPSVGAPVIVISRSLRGHGIVIGALVPAETAFVVTSVAVIVQVPEEPK